MGTTNAIKKLEAEVKRSKEDVENMDVRLVIHNSFGCFRIRSVTIPYLIFTS